MVSVEVMINVNFSIFGEAAILWSISHPSDIVLQRGGAYERSQGRMLLRFSQEQLPAWCSVDRSRQIGDFQWACSTESMYTVHWF